MSDNKIELSGIFSEGYGVIPKKLMKMKIPGNLKLILAYMLSYTGGGDTCFPGIRTIACDLGMSNTTVVKYIKIAVEKKLVIKTKFNNNPMNHANKYKLLFMSRPDVTVYDNIDVTSCNNIDVISGESTDVTPNETTMYNEVKQNNNNVNNNNINKKDNIQKSQKNKYLEYVLLTSEEYNRLCESYDKKIIEDYIERLNSYIGSKGKKYKSHYYTIISWLRMANVEKLKKPKRCPHCKTILVPGGLCRKCDIYINKADQIE